MTVAEQVHAEQQLGEALEQYAGEWVAVRDQTVVAHTATLQELLEQIEDTEVEAVFQVPEDSEVACFF
jgi:hypothetical protein